MRLFFGIELSAAASDAAADFMRSAKGAWPGRYVSASNLHMTVCFVGEVPEERLREVRMIGKLAARSMPRAPLALAASGCFGREEKGILYLNAEGGEAFAPLAAALRELLDAAGLPRDPKPFVPHITLARNADTRAPVKFRARPERWIPDCLTLFLSHRVENVLTYTPLARWRAGGG